MFYFGFAFVVRLIQPFRQRYANLKLLLSIGNTIRRSFGRSCVGHTPRAISESLFPAGAAQANPLEVYDR